MTFWLHRTPAQVRLPRAPRGCGGLLLAGSATAAAAAVLHAQDEPRVAAAEKEHQ